LKDKIALIGFMGSGKSTVGPLLSRKIGWHFQDLDDQIEKSANKSISAIFEEDGENRFREIETEVLLRSKSDKELVLACGGGVILQEDNVAFLRENFEIVYLELPLEMIKARLKRSKNRPLLKVNEPEEKIEKLYNERRDKYRQVADRTFPIDRGTNVRQVVDKIISKVMMNEADGLTLTVDLDNRSYDIMIGQGNLDSLGSSLDEKFKRVYKTVLISNDTVGPIYAEGVIESFKSRGIEVDYIEVDTGEEVKSLETAHFLYKRLLDIQADRSSILIALGGGVVGDLVGFVASTFMRGLDFIQIPTTLLAQVDSSVGGKTAVNLPEAKNIVGSFYQPKLVLIDLNTLRTLPERELRAGLGEVIKYGFIFDSELLEIIDDRLKSILSKDFEGLREIVYRCCEFKAGVVESDELDEKDIRARLNYGHTIGHALEAVSGYNRFRHGEAISIGMVGAAMISKRLGFIDKALVDRHIEILKKTGLPISYREIDTDEILNFIHMDKKRRAGALVMILLKDIGDPIVKEVGDDIIREVLRELKED